MKLQLIYLSVLALSQATPAYHPQYPAQFRPFITSRISNHPIRMSAFRPGVNLGSISMNNMPRQWSHPRFIQSQPFRSSYVMYRGGPPPRYSVKHVMPSTRSVYNGGPWKSAARLPHMPSISTTEFEFMKAASSPPLLKTDGGGLRTIPAPNLSLRNKPIVVVEGEKLSTSETPKPTYEVTEKYTDPASFVAKVEPPVGFSKATTQKHSEVQQSLKSNNVGIQFAADYGLPSIALSQQVVPQQVVPQQVVPQQVVPQQFAVQGQLYHGLPTQQEFMHSGAEGIVISPSALYQPDPSFLQKLQTQLLQRFPSVEFVPYAANLQHTEPQQQPQNHVFFLNRDFVTKQAPASFTTNENKNVVQRGTQEGNVVTLVPQTTTTFKDVSENVIDVTNQININTTAAQPTLELVTSKTQPITTTLKYITESNTQEPQNTTQPIYFANVGQSVANLVANGFFSAINDVRAAAAMAQVEKPDGNRTEDNSNATSTINPDLKTYFVETPTKDSNNQTVTELKSALGVPFTQSNESVNVEYTIVKSEDKDPKVTKDGAVYAGQLVEATVSEDSEYNKEKLHHFHRRPTLRIVTDTSNIIEHRDTTTIPSILSVTPRLSVIRTRMPQRSRLAYDDRTGEPVIRIYASYVDSPSQKDLVTSKLASAKRIREATRRKIDTVDNWKSSAAKNADKTYGSDSNQVSEFGLKLRSRSDDYIPIFEDYEDAN